MVKIISVRFKQGGKAYSFDPGELAPQAGDYVVVDTARGAECGEVVQGVQEVPDASVPKELKPVLRMADSVDIRRRKQNEQDEKLVNHEIRITKLENHHREAPGGEQSAH